MVNTRKTKTMKDSAAEILSKPVREKKSLVENPKSVKLDSGTTKAQTINEMKADVSTKVKTSMKVSSRQSLRRWWDISQCLQKSMLKSLRSLFVVVSEYEEEDPEATENAGVEERLVDVQETAKKVSNEICGNDESSEGSDYEFDEHVPKANESQSKEMEEQEVASDSEGYNKLYERGCSN
ncbi:hypothetical protein QQ045_033482 [Rhodiola kirilowii]